MAASLFHARVAVGARAHAWASDATSHSGHADVHAALPTAPLPRFSATLGAVGVTCTAALLVRERRRNWRRHLHRPTATQSTVRLRALSFFKKEGDLTTFPTGDGKEFEMDESKVLGVGAQGKVHVGRNTKTNEVVAIKAMPVKHLILDEAGAAKMKLIDKEFEVLKAVGRHPNIAHFIAAVDVYRPGTSDYPHAKMLVMEIVQGRELAEHVASSGGLEERIARHVFVEVLNGLAHMHKQGVIHRDLKLQNILVTGDVATLDSRVKLIDFGVAKYVGNEAFKTLVGTLEIMPPEMAKAKINYLPSSAERKVHIAKFKSPAEENPGFGFAQLTPEGFGARLNNVDPNGNAGKQGLRDDWILTKINDINVENMLFQANADDSKHAKMPKIVNTLMSLSSDFTLEVIEMPPRKFTAKVDMWAAGIVLYTCLAGKTPFKNEHDIIEADYAKELIESSSEEAKALIAGLLVKDPEKRLSLDECLTHPWVACAAKNECTVAESAV